MTKTESELEKIIKPIVERLGYELYDVEFKKEVSNWYLRVYIDSKNGIDLDDCEKVSNEVSDMLDEKDPISMQYTLEVSSCGLERNLREKKHFEMAINKNVELRLYKSLNKEKVIAGKLLKVTDEFVTLEMDSSEINVDLSNISSAKILFNWEELENE